MPAVVTVAMTAELRNDRGTSITVVTSLYASSEGWRGNHTGGDCTVSWAVFRLVSTIQASGKAATTQHTSTTAPASRRRQFGGRQRPARRPLTAPSRAANTAVIGAPSGACQRASPGERAADSGLGGRGTPWRSLFGVPAQEREHEPDRGHQRQQQHHGHRRSEPALRALDAHPADVE